MSFVQIVEFHTSRWEDWRAQIDEYQKSSEGKRTGRRVVVGRDRNDPNHFFTMAFFDSYESAMENSNLPETQQLAEKLRELADGPATFRDLDVVEERS